MNARLNRRQALGALGTISLGGLLAACGDEGGGDTAVRTTGGDTATVQPRPATTATTATRFDDAASCSVTPQQTEGPFYFDVDSIRRDIREDREGTRLRVGIRVRDAATCEPIEDAVVDIWHADAAGGYSGFDAGSGGARTATRYLRGAQVTDAAGIAEFVTIYPGWYPGRTAHIHAKVHLDAATVLTTQLYFDEKVSDAVYAAAPYAARGPRDQRNASDAIFDAALVMTTSRQGDGYLGLMNVDVRRA